MFLRTQILELTLHTGTTVNVVLLTYLLTCLPTNSKETLRVNIRTSDVAILRWKHYIFVYYYGINDVNLNVDRVELIERRDWSDYPAYNFMTRISITCCTTCYTYPCHEIIGGIIWLINIRSCLLYNIRYYYRHPCVATEPIMFYSWFIFFFFFLFNARSQKLLDRSSPNFQQICILV